MQKTLLRSTLLGAVGAVCLSSAVHAETFNIPGGDLASALEAYTAQSGVQLVVSHDLIKNVRTRGVAGSLSSSDALVHLLKGTGLSVHREDGAVAIIPGQSSAMDVPAFEMAQAASPRASAVETVTVTSSKLGGADVQTVPIAITALSQEQLTATQTVGGPDLVKQVPNLNFSKTNFTGYNIQIRGIGTQAISVTTDPAVAVAFNDTPFLRNHFFEQEFYDVAQAEVLRGPQGTLYGRNATAGVINILSARPTDQFEANVSGDVGNYNERRLEGMVNLPLVDDRIDLRVAAEWTKRDGYTKNETLGKSIDGRDLWSSRMTLGLKPVEDLQIYLVWEHFSEDDDRERSTKQLCKRDPGASSFTAQLPDGSTLSLPNLDGAAKNFLSQGCLPASPYSPDSFETPNGQSLPFIYGAEFANGFIPYMQKVDPYASVTQPTDLRVIQSELSPIYKAKNDTVELSATYKLASALTLISETGYNNDQLHSTEDFNRFNSASNVFFATRPQFGAGQSGTAIWLTPNGVLCDPQLGCSTKVVGEDLSQEHAWQVSQELRLTSNFTGPLNFSVGGNYLHYETEEDYYVFINVLTLLARSLDLVDTINPNSTNYYATDTCIGNVPAPHIYPIINESNAAFNCPNVDSSSINQLIANGGGQGHNYFRSVNPYLLDSYAGFGEAYYQPSQDWKFIGGVRWTDDRKHFVEIPSELLTNFWGLPVQSVVDQQWQQFTGRAVVNWMPKLSFTDQTLVYGSFSRGYKAGGANPPGPSVYGGGQSQFAALNHPLTFKPEFVNAFEAGTKNTLLDGAITFNASAFYYDYKNYQISEIVDRTSINLNFDANVRGAEIETAWEPVPGLRFNFAGGWEDSKLASGSKAIDLMDRTAGTPGWTVVKPNIFATSNCIVPTYVIAEIIANNRAIIAAHPGDPFPPQDGSNLNTICTNAYNLNLDPVAALYAPPNNAAADAIYQTSGFSPSSAPNAGAGFDKNLAGNELPNAPPFTVSIGAQYSMPLTTDWAGTLHADYYWQDYSWARVFNDDPFDRLRGYTNVNLALILTSQSGWQIMLYDKNVFDTTAITGTFLNSDDTGLPTNVFVTDPRLFGVRLTKNW